MKSEKQKKSLRKKLLIGAGVGLFIFIFLFALLHTGFVKSRVLRYASSYIERTQNVQFSAGSLNYNLLQLSFSLGDVSLQSLEKTKTEDPPFFQAQKVKIDIPLKLLLGKKLHFHEITVIQPKICFIIYQDSSNNLPFSRNSSINESSGHSIPEIVVKKLLLENAHVDLRDEEKDFAFQLSRLGVQVSWIDDSQHKVDLTINEEGSLQYKKNRFPVNEINLSGRLDTKEIHLENFKVQALKSEIFGSGRIEDFSKPFIYFDFQGSVDGESVKKFLNRGEDISGKIEFESLVQGPLDSIDAELKLQSSAFQYGAIASSDLRADAVWREQKLIIPFLNVSTPNGEFQASAELNPLNWKEGNQLDLKWESLDPNFYLDLFSVPFSVKTRLSGDLQASWDQLSLDSLKAKANLDFREDQRVVLKNSSIPLQGRIKADLDSGQLSINAEEINIPGVLLSGKFGLKSNELSGDYWFQILSLDDLIPYLSLFSPELRPQDIKQWNLKGKAKGSGSLGGSLNSPRIKANVESSQFSVKNFQDLRLSGKFEYDSESMRFESMEILAGEGMLKFSLLYKDRKIILDSLKGNQAETRIQANGMFDLEEKSYNGHFSADSLRIKDFVFNQGDEFLSGLVHLNLEGEGSLDSPNFIMEANIEKLKWGKKEIGETNIHVSSSAGTAQYKVSHLSSSSTFKGSFRLSDPFPSVQDFSLHTDINLNLISLLLDEVNAKGRLESEIFFPKGFVFSELQASLRLIEGELLFIQPGLLLRQIKANIQISEGTAEISSIAFNIGEGQYVLSGEVPFETFTGQVDFLNVSPENQKFSIHASWKNLGTSALSSLLSGDVFGKYQGESDGRLHVTGSRFQWDQVSGNADIYKLDFHTPDVSFQLKKPANLTFDKGALFFKEAEFFGKESQLKLTGVLGLFPGQTTDMTLQGDLSLSILQPFLTDASLSGKALFQVNITQSLSNPHISGNLEIHNGEWSTDLPPFVLSKAEGIISFDQTKIHIRKIQGELNGGNINISGEVDLGMKEHLLTRLEVTADGVLLEFPKGMQSEIDLTLNFSSSGNKDLLSGNLNIVSAKYTEPYKVQSALLQYLRREASIESFIEPNEFLSQLQLNISIEAQESLLVENNISRSLLSANLTLTGTLLRPVLSGRAQFEEGGEVYFGGNTFVIETGYADFINPTRIEPDLNIKAVTRVGEYEISLLLTGTPDQFNAGLMSDPPLSEPDIISLLVTGRTLESASGQILGVAGNKALSYINSSLTGQLEKTTQQRFGFESVKIDASLIAAEENPRARITVGQHVSRDVELVYSQDLKDAQNRMWIVNYNPTTNVNLQGIKRDENEYTVGIQHDLKFGSPGTKKPRESGAVTPELQSLSQVDSSGEKTALDKKIRSLMKLREDKRFDPLVLQKDLENIKEYYKKKHHLNAVVRADKRQEGKNVSLSLYIDPGPKIFVQFKGAKISPKFRNQVKDIFMRSTSSGWAFREAQSQLLLHLTEKKYFQAQAQVEEHISQEQEKNIVFQINPGVKYTDLLLSVEGNRFLSQKEIEKLLKKSGQFKNLFVRPEKGIKSLENYYSQFGFLRPKVKVLETRFQPENQTAEMSLRIDEGLRFQIGEVKVHGNRFFDEEQIIHIGGFEKPQFFSQAKVSNGRSKIRDKYVEKGFIHAQVHSEVMVHEEKGSVDCVFRINENRQGVIKDINITGNKRTKINTISRELSFNLEDTVNFRDIRESQKKLYDLGIFQRVDVEAVPLEGNGSDEDESTNRMQQVQNYQIKAHVHELQPYRLRYGIHFDTEKYFGLKGELVDRNFWGRAQLIGTSFRINQDEQDIKTFIRSPYFLGWKINTETFAFFNRTHKPSFSVDRTGLTFLQQVKLNKFYLLSFDYTYEQSRTFNLKLSSPMDFNPTAQIGSFNLSLTRDTRDSMTNAREGMFLSHNIKYAPKFLGSETRFIRYFGQAYVYIPVADSLVYSTGLRIGLAKGIRSELVPSERFFAGGSSTVRGFGKDALGPRDLMTGDPLGGEAVFIFNQELRFPVYKILGGAVFMDLGNVYSELSDFDPFDMRKTAGLGLRVHTSFMIFRLDWGFKLDPQPGEPKYKFFLSVGQAF